MHQYMLSDIQLENSLAENSWWTPKLNTSHKDALVAKKADGGISCINRSVARSSGEGILPLYSTVVGQCPVLGSSAWEGHGHTGTAKSQEGDGLKHFPYEERLRELGLSSLEKRGLWRDPFTVHKYLKGRQKWDRIRLFSVTGSESVGIN